MNKQTLELWAKVKDGLDESWITYSENRRAVDAFESALSGPVAQPVAWIPVKPTREWFVQVAVLANVWPESNKDHVPFAILDAIRCYHHAMLAAATEQDKP